MYSHYIIVMYPVNQLLLKYYKICDKMFICTLHQLKGVVMSFFNRLFKKQGQPNGSTAIKVDPSSSDSESPAYVKSDEDFTVCIKTDKELSEEQQDAIFSIVKTGLYENNEIPSKVCITLMLSTGIMETMILNRTSEGSAELIF